MALVILKKLIRKLVNPVGGFQVMRRDFQQENGGVVVPYSESQGSDVIAQSHINPWNSPPPGMEGKENHLSVNN